MHGLGGEERAAKMLLHHDAVLQLPRPLSGLIAQLDLDVAVALP
jgi:hypothetical protein